MLHKEKDISVSGMIILLLIFFNAVILKVAFVQNENWYQALLVTLPLLLFAFQYERKIKRQFLHNSPKPDSLNYFYRRARLSKGKSVLTKFQHLNNNNNKN